ASSSRSSVGCSGESLRPGRATTVRSAERENISSEIDANQPREGSNLKQRKRWLSLVAVLVAAALVAAGCGDDGDEGTSSTTGAPNTTVEGGGGEGNGEVEGCGPEAATDPTDMSVGREVARCEPGFPAPQPLPEMTTINVSSAFR